MDEVESPTELVEAVDGVELTKYLKVEGFRFPSIVYEIESDRDEPVTVRVEDPIPQGVAVEDVGFHPAYGDDYWSVEDATLVFEYELEPRAQYKTVYAVRGTDEDEIEGALAPAEQIEIEPEADDSVELEAEGGDESLELEIDEGDESTTLDADESDESAEPEMLTRSAADSPYGSGADSPSIDIESVPEAESLAQGVDGDDFQSDRDAAVASESLVDRLAAEVQEGKPAQESLEVLAAQFSDGSETGGSVDARLEQIQGDISDLRAYTTALEEFLDDNGGAREIVEEFQARQDDFDDGLDSVESNLAELTEELRGVREAVTELDEDVDRVSADLDDVSERVVSLEDDLEGLDDRVPAYAIDERFADIENDLEGLSDFVDSLKTAFE